MILSFRVTQKNQEGALRPVENGHLSDAPSSPQSALLQFHARVAELDAWLVSSRCPVKLRRMGLPVILQGGFYVDGTRPPPSNFAAMPRGPARDAAGVFTSRRLTLGRHVNRRRLNAYVVDIDRQVRCRSIPLGAACAPVQGEHDHRRQQSLARQIQAFKKKMNKGKSVPDLADLQNLVHDAAMALFCLDIVVSRGIMIHCVADYFLSDDADMYSRELGWESLLGDIADKLDAMADGWPYELPVQAKS